MKQPLLLLLSTLLTTISFSQCTCTGTISGLESNPRIVTMGQTLCITSTGQMTGDILVDGGTLCNEGLINNTFVWVTSGGRFINNSTGNQCDSLLVVGSNSLFLNSGSFSNERMAATNGGSISNSESGIIQSNYFADSATVVENAGKWICGTDFYNLANGEFRNTGELTVNSGFYNAINGTVMNNCIIRVNGNFYNAGTIYAHVDLPAGCIRVAGESYNEGNMQLLSFYDASSPSGDLDFNSGTSNVLINQCNSSCAVGIEETLSVSSVQLFPNPTDQFLTIQGMDEFANTEIEIRNTFGQLVYRQNLGHHKDLQLSVADLPEGFYVIVLKTEGKSLAFSHFIKS
jgi:hypothetical protein